MYIKKLTSSKPESLALGFALIRLSYGMLLAYHGFTKLLSYNEVLPYFPDFIGIGAATSLVLVIVAELVGGVMIALGLLTRLAAIPVFVTMAVAFFVAHAKDPFQVKELAFVYLVLSVAFALAGSGKYAVDTVVFNNATNTEKNVSTTSI